MIILKRGLVFIFILLFLFSLFLFYISITDYKPEEIVELSINNNQVKIINSLSDLTITTYNIGYGSLDNSQDFLQMEGKTLEQKIERKY